MTVAIAIAGLGLVAVLGARELRRLVLNFALLDVLERLEDNAPSSWDLTLP